MKDMKQMVKDPTAGARARRAEAKADGLISIKLGAAGGGDANNSNNTANANAAAFKKGGFKKSGFKSAFAPVGGGTAAVAEDVEMKTEKAPIIPGRENLLATTGDLDVESDTEDEGYEVYNPRFPTD